MIHEAARTERSRLYLAALKGDWKSVQGMLKIQREITKARETTLHVAAAANKEEFVKNLVSNTMSSEDLKVENIFWKHGLILCCCNWKCEYCKGDAGEK